MAEDIDQKQVTSYIRGLNQTAKGRRILQQAMREAGIDQPGGDVDKYANKAFSDARQAAKAEGKGFFRQVGAGLKAARETQEQYQLATMGTKRNRERILNMLGIEVGDVFRKNFEKKGTPEEIAAAKERFKIDKKTKDKAKKEGGGEGDFKSGRSLNFILKNVLELKDMVRKIESLLTKPKLKAGFTFDPRLGASGGYRSTRGENKGKIVSAKEALAAPKVSKAEKAEAAKVARTEALSKAILADEDPMVKLQESVLAILKSVGEDSRTIHQKLDDLKNDSGGDGGFGLGDLLDIGTRRRGPGRRTPKKTPKGKPKGRIGKGLGKGIASAGKAIGKFGKFIPGVGAVVAGGMAAYDGVTGFQNAGEILDLKEGEQATTGQKLSAAAGSVVSGLTFGLVDEKTVAKGIASATGAGPAPAPAPSSGPKFRLGPAAAKRGKIEASAGKNAALAAAGKAGITGAHLAQFMAQLDHESGHFTRVEENLRYSAKRLRQIFPKYYKTDAEAQADEMQPQKIANRVYANRMGNGPPESGDGYKYRGRGLIQLTGKDNYKRFGSMVGMDLVSNPDMAGSLSTAADIAAAFYKKNVMDRGIPAEDTKKVTKAINGGSIGLADRESLFASYMKDAGSLQPSGAPPATGEETAEKPLYASAEQSVPASGGGTPQATEAKSETLTAQAAPPVPKATPAPTEALQPQQSTAGPAMAAASDQLAQNQMVAQNAPPPAPVVVNSGGGGGKSSTPPPQKAQLAKAPTRNNDNSFTRALARDFSHPTAFTTVSMV